MSNLIFGKITFGQQRKNEITKSSISEKKTMSKHKLDPRTNYDPDGGYWNYDLNMWIKYDDMEMVL